MKKLLIALFLLTIIVFSCEETGTDCWNCKSKAIDFSYEKTETYCGEESGMCEIERRIPDPRYLPWECVLMSTNNEVK